MAFSEATTDKILAYREKLVNFMTRKTGSREHGEDIAQEAMLHAFAYSAKGGEEPRYVSAFMGRIALNILISELRRTHAKDTKEAHLMQFATGEQHDHFLSSLFARRTNPDAALELDEFLERVEQLDPRYSVPFYMRYIEDRSINEISETLSLPTGTVKSRIHRAKIMLGVPFEMRRTSSPIHDPTHLEAA